MGDIFQMEKILSSKSDIRFVLIIQGEEMFIMPDT